MFTPNPIANGSNSESSDSDAEKQAEEQKSGQNLTMGHLWLPPCNMLTSCFNLSMSFTPVRVSCCLTLPKAKRQVTVTLSCVRTHYTAGLSVVLAHKR